MALNKKERKAQAIALDNKWKNASVRDSVGKLRAMTKRKRGIVQKNS